MPEETRALSEDTQYLFKGNNFARWVICATCGLRVAYWPTLGYTGHSRRNTNPEVIMAALLRCQELWNTSLMNEKVIRDHIALEEAERRIRAITAKSKSKAYPKAKGKGRGKGKPSVPTPQPVQETSIQTPQIEQVPVRRSQSVSTPMVKPKANPTTRPSTTQRASSTPPIPHYRLDHQEEQEEEWMETSLEQEEIPWDEEEVEQQ
jgi:hypothetical protein